MYTKCLLEKSIYIKKLNLQKKIMLQKENYNQRDESQVTPSCKIVYLSGRSWFSSWMIGKSHAETSSEESGDEL